MSHPSWVRGLKHPIYRKDCSLNSVAPLVGAWIETQKNKVKRNPFDVAPLVGAWIETVFVRCCRADELSHPSWVRGLKQ